MRPGCVQLAGSLRLTSQPNYTSYRLPQAPAVMPVVTSLCPAAVDVVCALLLRRLDDEQRLVVGIVDQRAQ